VVDELTCYKGLADWRWPAYILTIYVPMGFVCLEFCLNRIRIPAKFVVVQLVVAVAYLLGTFFGQFLLSQPIYPNITDWMFAQNTDGAFAAFFLIMIFAGMAIFYLLMFISHFKVSKCCLSREKIHESDDERDESIPGTSLPKN
jgi:hypothetical protein